MLKCVWCGLRSGYNRVLVERPDGTEYGGLCIECEEHRFGDRLRRADGSVTEKCGLCDCEVHVHVPEWDPETEVLPNGTVVVNDYRVTDGTVGLCEGHFDSLTGRDSAEQSPPERAHPHQTEGRQTVS